MILTVLRRVDGGTLVVLAPVVAADAVLTLQVRLADGVQRQSWRTASLRAAVLAVRTVSQSQRRAARVVFGLTRVSGVGGHALLTGRAAGPPACRLTEVPDADVAATLPSETLIPGGTGRPCWFAQDADVRRRADVPRRTSLHGIRPETRPRRRQLLNIDHLGRRRRVGLAAHTEQTHQRFEKQPLPPAGGCAAVLGRRRAGQRAGDEDKKQRHRQLHGAR